MLVEVTATNSFGVSRPVVREALSRLKTLGLIETRQGSGAFVSQASRRALESLELAPDGSLDAVFQMVEVRRALEAEAAGCQRRGLSGATAPAGCRLAAMATA